MEENEYDRYLQVLIGGNQHPILNIQDNYYHDFVSQNHSYFYYTQNQPSVPFPNL